MKRFYIFLLILFFVGNSARATVHTITFGYPFFSPSSLNVNVGDTIIWSGDFSMHTLKTTSVPSGASSIDFENNGQPPGGSSFMYVAKVAGLYSYICTLHVTAGMKGSFTVAAAGVESPSEVNMILNPIYPNPVRDEGMVMFTLDKPAHVTLRIFNALGGLVQTADDENMSAGMHMLMLDTKNLASGTYLYALQAGDAVLERNMIVVK